MSKRVSQLEKIEAEERQRELEKQRERDAERERLIAQAKADCEILEMDFDDISWDDAAAFAELLSREIMATDEDALEQAAQLRSDLYKFVARIVTDVPADWFVSSLNGAAKDFSDPALYRKLKATRSQRLISAMNYALEEAQKN